MNNCIGCELSTSTRRLRAESNAISACTRFLVVRKRKPEVKRSKPGRGAVRRVHPIKLKLPPPRPGQGIEYGVYRF